MFKSNLEMCWNVKVNFADPCNTVADHQGIYNMWRCLKKYSLVYFFEKT